MNSLASLLSNDAYADGHSPGSEWFLKLAPKFPRTSSQLPGVQFVHGAGSRATYCLDEIAKQGRLTSKVVSADFTACAGDNAGTQTWGNPASLSRVGLNLTKLAAMPGAHATSYSLVSASMGGLVSLNYAAQASVKPRAIVTVIPVINLGDVVTNNRGGYGSLASTAHGTYNEGTMGSTRNPYTMRAMSKLMGIPMLIFYGLTDTICLPSFTEEFAAADPSNRTLVSLPSGHDYTSYDLVDHDMIVDFLLTHT